MCLNLHKQPGPTPKHVDVGEDVVEAKDVDVGASKFRINRWNFLSRQLMDSHSNLYFDVFILYISCSIAPPNMPKHQYLKIASMH